MAPRRFHLQRYCLAGGEHSVFDLLKRLSGTTLSWRSTASECVSPIP
jgi:hypothetical protein